VRPANHIFSIVVHRQQDERLLQFLYHVEECSTQLSGPCTASSSPCEQPQRSAGRGSEAANRLVLLPGPNRFAVCTADGERKDTCSLGNRS
jgi:hypothetical protein